MLEALQKGDEVVTAGGAARPHRQADRPVRHGRDRGEDRNHRPAWRGRPTAAQGHDQESLKPGQRQSTSDEPLPPLEIRRHRRRAAGRLHLHAAELLPGGAGGPGVVDQGGGQDRQRGARQVEDALKAAGIAYRGATARPDRHQGALRRPRHAAEGEGRAAGEARRQLHRRAQPAVGVAAVADGDRRAADVPRPRSARRRALPAAGRHEGGARQGRRPLHHRHPLAAAREEGPVLRRRARGHQRGRPLPRRRRAHQGARRDREGVPRPRCCAKPTPAAASCASSARSSPKRRRTSRTAPSSRTSRSCATA